MTIRDARKRQVSEIDIPMRGTSVELVLDVEQGDIVVLLGVVALVGIVTMVGTVALPVKLMGQENMWSQGMRTHKCVC